MSSAAEATRITYRRELLRAPFYGILDAGWVSFALLIAIRVHDAPEWIKSLISAAAPMGFLVAPLTLVLSAGAGLRPPQAVAMLMGGSALLLVGATVGSGLAVYTVCIVAAMMLAAQQGSMLTAVYAENYPARERGRRVGTTLVIANLASVLFSLGGGYLLDLDLGHYRTLFGTMAAAALVSAAVVLPVPASPLSPEHAGRLWRNLSLLWTDRLFGWLLGSWMLLGIGNLITLPIRVEYLADPAHGIDADNTTIALLLVVVPSLVRILSGRFWGRVFDRLNLVTTRNLLNGFFFLGILLFFTSRNLWVLGFAMACIGAAMGGGRVVWTLWVTKISPPEKTSAYMSVHMALTGLRGTAAPFIGYWILSRSDPRTVGLTGSCLILVSMGLFWMARNHARLR